MNLTIKQILILNLLLFFTNACSDQKGLLTNNTNPVYVEKIYALDGLKLIAKDIIDPLSEKTFNQTRYQISAESRLLIRYENLESKNLNLQADKPIYLRIFVGKTDDLNSARNSLKICPILRNWMLMATWTKAHPYPGGHWSEGGELSHEDCVSYDTTAAQAVAGCAKVNAICFDVNPWYQAFMIERNTNYGLALISADGLAIEIIGDNAGSQAPRIHWFEPPK